jgi:hypothetical protein
MAEPVGGGPIVPVRFWPGSGSTPVGKTAFGTFDDDDEFEETAPMVAKWVCNTLGYPIVSIELEDQNIYTNFEMATMKFASIVNEFNMRENMMAYQGMSTGSSFSQTLIRSTPIPYIVKLAADYGTEAESGGTVDVKRGFVTIVAGQTEYNLQSLWAATSESGNRLEIRRIFHERVPAMQRFFDPFAGTGTDMSSMLGSFGWTGYAVASNFLLMPMYETLLRAQAIELNDTIRRSGFSFQIHNNKVRIFPVPSIDDDGSRMWFEYMVEADKFTLSPSGSGASGRAEHGVVSDYSNVPFMFVPFEDINDVGREWIYRYTLALCKITLGNIRSKYDSLPVPDAEVRLDGTTLRQEGQAEIEKLIDHLRETLEQTGKSAQMKKQQENEENMMLIMQHIPTQIYIF